jgi:hypothetical protein
VWITNVNELGALSNPGNEGFLKMKKNIEVRKQLHYYLANKRDSTQEKKNGVLFGKFKKTTAFEETFIFHQNLS